MMPFIFIIETSHVDEQLSKHEISSKFYLQSPCLKSISVKTDSLSSKVASFITALFCYDYF
jgi:hypothetical protein